jgi:hypothetical protein
MSFKINMNKLKVIKVSDEGIFFNNGYTMISSHEQDCCESHELTFSDLDLSDFEDLEFDLTNGNFFKKIEGYGIELIPLKGHSVRIPGHGSNNGYYGTNIELVILDEKKNNYKVFDVSECQVIDYE